MMIEVACLYFQGGFLLLGFTFDGDNSLFDEFQCGQEFMDSAGIMFILQKGDSVVVTSDSEIE